MPASPPLPATLPRPETVDAATALLWSVPAGTLHWDTAEPVRLRLIGPADPARFAPGAVMQPPAGAAEALARAAAAWDAVCGLELHPTQDDPAEVRVGFARFPDNARHVAWTVVDPDPDGTIREAEVWLDVRLAHRLEPGDFGALALLHELGHALGLTHPQAIAPAFASYNSRAFTVMSYLPVGVEPATPLVYDIAAVQELYGPDRRAGDDRYRLDAGTPRLSALWDGGGHDLLDGRCLRDSAVLDLREGGRSRFDVADGPAELQIAFGTVIEDAYGGRGDDLLIGNGADNRLWGGAGNDRLVGLSGNDQLVGGAGDDLLEGGAGHDRLIGGPGIDIAIFEGSLAEYRVTRSGRNWVVEHASGTQDRDLLRGVEIAVFDDGALSLARGVALPLEAAFDLDALLHRPGPEGIF